MTGKAFLTLALALIGAVAASPDDEPFACGSSPELTRWAEEFGSWSATRARLMASKGLPSATAQQRDNIYFLAADDVNAPFRRSFDLSGRTLNFTRRGAAGFSVANVPLAYLTDVGTVVSWGGQDAAAVDLGFDFPFFGTSVRRVTASQFNAIFLDASPVPDLKQFGDAEIGAMRRPVIAPLLTTERSSFGLPPSLFVKKSSDSVLLTWRAGTRQEIQVILFRSGNITFSYKTVTPAAVAAGALLITSGAEPWRNERMSITSAVDPSDDLAITVAPDLAGAYDITGVNFSNIAGTDMLEIRIDVRGPLDRTAIPSSQPILDDVAFGPAGSRQYVRLYVYEDGDYYSMPAWGGQSGSTAARIEGSSVVLHVMYEHLSGVTSPDVRVSTIRSGRSVDSVSSLSVALPVPTRKIRTDFSALSTATLENGPISEAFTLPVVSVHRVWQQLKQSDPILIDGDIDAVAIYQNFYTDIITFAGAYATGGNSAATGLASGDEFFAALPRTPNLMHMNRLGYGHYATSRGSSRVALHEFGHRWLLFVSVMQDGVRRFTLNPVSAHPAQYVDTRAAFKVYTDSDSSVMGGGFFTDNNDGTFTTGPSAAYGYSWLDLYLMGLADPSEVRPWFYVADSSPPLGDEYYAPSNSTYMGTRKEVTLQQVIDATGERRPARPDAQRRFKAVFVLLTDPEREPTQDELELIQQYRALMESDFRIATSQRGEVSTSLAPPPPAPPRRRAVRR